MIIIKDKRRRRKRRRGKEPEELLNIVLHEAVQGLPPKRLRQLLCPHWLVVKLKGSSDTI